MEIMVTKEFKKAFQMCMKHWEVTGYELEFEKERVRKNYAEAEICYLSIASGIGGTGNSESLT